MQIESHRELPARVSSRIEKSARRSFDPKTLHNSNSCLFVQQHCLALRVHQSLTTCSDTVKSPDTVHQHCPVIKHAGTARLMTVSSTSAQAVPSTKQKNTSSIFTSLSWNVEYIGIVQTKKGVWICIQLCLNVYNITTEEHQSTLPSWTEVTLIKTTHVHCHWRASYCQS